MNPQSGPPDQSNRPSPLPLLLTKVEALETMVGDLCARRVPLLESLLHDLRGLLGSRRKEHYVVEEVAALTGRTPYTVRRWIAQRKLRAIRIRDGGPRGRLLISRNELERLVGAGMGAEVPEVALG